MKFTKLKKSDLSEAGLKLLETASEVRKNAYAPYSGFYVGASAECAGGKIFSAANMENASYGLTVCAESGALQAAISAGENKVVAITIVGGKDPAVPCGRCRQLIFETSVAGGHDIEITCSNADQSKIIKTTISELLPIPFGPDDLKDKH